MRGKTRVLLQQRLPGAVASMRPPQNAGENSRGGQFEREIPHGFNEAPAECGGKQVAATAKRCRCFNEAPAECGGKPPPPEAVASATKVLQRGPRRMRGKTSTAVLL